MTQSGGALAEYTVGSIATTAKRPHDISAIDGAAVGTCGFSALQSVRNSAGIALDGSPQITKNLLITGASGGVGTLAVQVLLLSLKSQNVVNLKLDLPCPASLSFWDAMSFNSCGFTSWCNNLRRQKGSGF